MTDDALRMRLTRAAARDGGVLCVRCCKRRRSPGRARCAHCLRAGVIHSARHDARLRALTASMLLEVALADGKRLDKLPKKIAEPSLKWAVEVRDRMDT